MKRLLFPLFLVFLSASFLYGQDVREEHEFRDTINAGVDIFEGMAPMDFTLTFNMKEQQRKKNTDEYLPAELCVHLNDNDEVIKEVRLKARGKFRKKTCHYSPFWLNIRKADVENEYLQEVKKMKVVTRCRAGDDYNDYVLLEYLAYKIYEILTPHSFRTRLISMKYVDTGRKNKVTDSWAFLIEPEGMLAERFDGMAMKKDSLSMVLMRPDEMMLAAMFQYMIGNCDYSIAGRHNMKILGLPGFGTKGYTPVPYDFDYAGLVNASYAIPGENLGLTSVTQRYYLGRCGSDAEYQAAIQKLTDHREEILELIQTFPYLSEKSRGNAIGYVESFYAEASGVKFIDRNLSKTCR